MGEIIQGKNAITVRYSEHLVSIPKSTESEPDVIAVDEAEYFKNQVF